MPEFLRIPNKFNRLFGQIKLHFPVVRRNGFSSIFKQGPQLDFLKLEFLFTRLFVCSRMRPT